MLFWFKWSYSLSCARKHFSSFHSKFKNTADTIDWSMCLSYYFFVFPCSSDTIRSFYGQISICRKPSLASFREYLFFFGYRRSLFILRDIDHISDPYLHFSGLVWYEKLWERVYYSISNSWISNDRRVLHAGSSTILCSPRKRLNPYVVRSWASTIRREKAFLTLQGPCAVNPLQAVVRRHKVVAAKLSRRGVVLCVSIAFLVEPAQLNKEEPNLTDTSFSFWEASSARRTSTRRLLGSCMDMQEGVLLGVCVGVGCVCSREWTFGCGHTCANSGNGYKVKSWDSD